MIVYTAAPSPSRPPFLSEVEWSPSLSLSPLPPPWASVRRNEKAVCPPFPLSLPLSSLIPRHVRGFFLIRMRGRLTSPLFSPLSDLACLWSPLLVISANRFPLCVCEQRRDFAHAHLRVGAAVEFLPGQFYCNLASISLPLLKSNVNVITSGCN